MNRRRGQNSKIHVTRVHMQILRVLVHVITELVAGCTVVGALINASKY